MFVYIVYIISLINSWQLVFVILKIRCKIKLFLFLFLFLRYVNQVSLTFIQWLLIVR